MGLLFRLIGIQKQHRYAGDRNDQREDEQRGQCRMQARQRPQTALRHSGSVDALAIAKRLDAARAALVEGIDFVAGHTKASPNAVFSGSVPYLMLAGNVMAGWQMARSMLAAEQSLAKGQDADFMQAKITTARFYADHILTKAPGLRDSIVEGADSVTAMALDAF